MYWQQSDPNIRAFENYKTYIETKMCEYRMDYNY